MYEHVIAETTAEDGTPFRVIIEQDTDSADLDPRNDYSNAGVMYVQTQQRYEVPQEADLSGWASPDLDDAIDRHDFRVVARWLRVFHGATTVLPLYSSYSGNEWNVSAGELDDAPEAGDYIGVTFDTAQTRDDTGFVSPEQMAAAMAADVQTYRMWADGDVWSYVVQTAWVDDGDGEITGWGVADDMGSTCSGFIGQKWAEEAAEEALDSVVESYNEEVARRAADAAELEEEIDSLRRSELGLPV